jgi:hypothetical protein
MDVLRPAGPQSRNVGWLRALLTAHGALANDENTPRGFYDVDIFAGCMFWWSSSVWNKRPTQLSLASTLALLSMIRKTPYPHSSNDGAVRTTP